MLIRNRKTGMLLTLSRREYYAGFGKNYDWEDVTKPRSAKQIAVSEKFVQLGKLHRTKANLEEVVRIFGSNNGAFTDAINGINYFISEVNKAKLS